MLDPDLVGRTFHGAEVVVISQSQIDQFCAVVGETVTEVSPPTFSISITLDQSQTLLQDSGLDWSRVVHGDQKFVISRPLIAGDSVTCSSTIESARVMAGNEIVTVRSDLHSGSELLVSTWSTLVVRA
ncbi:MAG: MaoC family dehydratase N-terminal domain-containing protein [Actinomycetes bacterium]